MALAVAVDPGWMLLLWVVLLFVGIELVVTNVLEPWVYAANTGLSSVALIAAATFWTWLWGPIGLLLSAPLTVFLVVLGRHVPQLEFLDVLLGNEPVLSPDETFYQRLRANDPEEATEQAEEFLKEGPIAGFFDEVAIPALVRAQVDSDDGKLSPERRLMFKDGIRAMLEDLSGDAPADASSITERAAPPIIEGASGIVCVAGRNELDEAAASLLVHLLRFGTICRDCRSASCGGADIGSLSLFAPARECNMPLADQHSLAGSSALYRPAAFSARTGRAGVGWSLEIGPGRACGYGRDDRSAKYCRCNLTPQRRHEPSIRPVPRWRPCACRPRHWSNYRDLGRNATIRSRATPYSPGDARGLLVDAHQQAQRLTRTRKA